MIQVVQKSYGLLGLISFLTAGEPEVRAWTIRKGTNAQHSAGVIHSDIERGFIRAEVIKYDDYIALKTPAALKAAGKQRLEGKEYIIQDGDVILFRFNV
jgi:ribosome-binding ATPase YchF (GTP1/OBG family)